MADDAVLSAAPQPEHVEPPDRFVENWDEWFEKHNASRLAAKIAAAVRAENEACALRVEQNLLPTLAGIIRARMDGK